MVDDRLRAWWFHKQGLDGLCVNKPLEEVLSMTGWSRSVGGANPYLALRARCGCDRAAVDRAVAEFRIHELPSARGCTYVLPNSHFSLGLTVGRGFSDESAISVAVKHLGVTSDEIDKLGDAVCRALDKGPLDPKQIKERLGTMVRAFGEEGKKRGVSTDLPLALGRLQSHGKVRRIPINGRLDNQRYAYRLWNEGPALIEMSKEEAHMELARLYFSWTGGATLKSFQWFSGLYVKTSQDSVRDLNLVPLTEGSDLLCLPEDAELFASFKAPREPVYTLVGSIDNLTHLRLGLSDMLDPEDRNRSVPGEKGLLQVGGISELSSHAIYDRGRLIGVWDYDAQSNRLVSQVWIEKDEALKGAMDNMEAFVRDDLGDARTFSLDSPESRKTRLAGYSPV